MLSRTPFILLILGGLPALAAAQDAAAAEPAPEPTAEAEPNPAYQEAAGQALAEYERGNWAEARALFLKAHELQPSARTFRTLGMTAFEMKDYVRAQRELSAALNDERRPLEGPLKGEVEGLLGRARAFVGRFIVALTPPGASLTVNGAPASLEEDGSLLLKLGGHTLRAEAEGHDSKSRVLDVQGHEDLEIGISLKPTPPPASEAAAPAAPAPVVVRGDGGHTWTWVAGGGAVVFGVATIGLYVAGNSEFNNLEEECRRRNAETPGSCDGDNPVDDSTLDTLENLTLVGGILTGVAAATAVTLFFVEGDGPDDEPSARVRLGPGSVQLTGRF